MAGRGALHVSVLQRGLRDQFGPECGEGWMMDAGGARADPKGSAGRITAPGAAHGGRSCGRGLAGAPPRNHMPLPAGVAARRGSGSGQVGAASSAGRCGVSRMLHAAKSVRQDAACLAPVSRKGGRRVPRGAKAARGIGAYGTAALATMRSIRCPGRVGATAQSPKHSTAAGGQSMPGVGSTPGKRRRPRARGTGSLKGWNAGSGAVRMV